MKIIFQNEDGTVSIIHPTYESIRAYGLNAIAQKDVPSGSPYWFIEETSIPDDRTYRGAWEIDISVMGEPDGIGSESSEFEVNTNGDIND